MNTSQLGAGGIFAGVKPPKYLSGKFYLPQHCFPTSNTITLTATRRVYIPFFCAHTQTFAGIKFYNSGTGDNGKKVRTGVYAESATGGPGALVAECSEVTLTGAAAIRTATGSLALVGGRMYFLTLQADTAPVLYGMTSQEASTVASVFATHLGAFALDVSSANANTLPMADYVDTTYGAFPSTATAPTASYTMNGVGRLPLCGVYV